MSAWIKEMSYTCSIYTIHSLEKRKDSVIGKTWMDLESIVLSDNRHRKIKIIQFCYMWTLRLPN
jgi:hypothetical protein